MGGNGNWGDALTLTAMAHLTLRPIHVLTDNPLQPVLTITPPKTIADSAWGAPIIVTHQGEIHYEATINHQDIGFNEIPEKVEEIESVTSEIDGENDGVSDSSDLDEQPTNAQLITAGHKLSLIHI